MKSVCKASFVSTFLAAIYIVLVGLFMHYANNIFGTQDPLLGIVAVLILFSLSALIVGGLLIGKPIMLYLDNKKKEATNMLIANALWLFGFFLLALLVLYLGR